MRRAGLRIRSDSQACSGAQNHGIDCVPSRDGQLHSRGSRWAYSEADIEQWRLARRKYEVAIWLTCRHYPTDTNVAKKSEELKERERLGATAKTENFRLINMCALC